LAQEEKKYRNAEGLTPYRIFFLLPRNGWEPALGEIRQRVFHFLLHVFSAKKCAGGMLGAWIALTYLYGIATKE
jgi:hypothetical protein